LPVEKRITYKLAVLTFKIPRTPTPVYLSRHVAARSHMHGRSVRHPFRYYRRRSAGHLSANEPSAPLHRQHGTLPASVLDIDSLAAFKSKLKTHPFTVAYS